MINIELVKAHLRVDGNDDDGLISSYTNAAEGYLKGAGVKEEVDGYEAAVFMIVAILYEHRDPADGNISMPPILVNYITQLSMRSVVL